MDLGHRADRAPARPPRPAAGATAMAGRDAVDPVGVGLVEPFEELAGVGRERLDVAPLPLGVERVERQRALARPAHARQDDQPVERQVEVDPLEVVDPDPPEPDRPRVVGHRSGRPSPAPTDPRLRPIVPRGVADPQSATDRQRPFPISAHSREAGLPAPLTSLRSSISHVFDRDVVRLIRLDRWIGSNSQKVSTVHQYPSRQPAGRC